MKLSQIVSQLLLISFCFSSSYATSQLAQFTQDLWVANLKRVLDSNFDCCPRNSEKDTSPYNSQFGQDSYLNEKFFKNKKNGVFVDIGAHNGVSFSNTYFFENVLNWRGVCIEPMPRVFAELVKNRNCACINGCIADFEGIEKFIIVSADLPNIDMFSGLFNKYDPQHLANINATLQVHGGSIEVIDVKCYKLENILIAQNITHIDYLSLDTEGGELDILRSIDFTKISIDIIDVENNYSDPKIRIFLEKNGYEFVARLTVDEIYKKRNFNQN